MKNTGLILLALLLILSGCGFSPKAAEKAGEFGLPDSFSESGTQVLPKQWWIVFDDPELNKLVETALQDNFTLREAWDRLDQAAASAKAAGAALFPGISADAGASRSLNLTDLGGSNTRAWNSDITLGMSASYEIDLWGKNRNSRKAAAYDALASQQNLYTSAVSLTAQLATAWYSLTGQNIRVNLLKKQIAVNEKYLLSLEARFRQGIVSAADMLQAQAQIEAARGDLETALAVCEVLKHQIAVLCGKAPGELKLTIPDTFPDIPDMPQTGLPADLIRRRPDVGAAFLKIKSADARAAVSVAARFPSFSLSARGTTSDSEATGLFKNWFGNLAANLAAPIFAGGRLSAEAERSKAGAQQALNSWKGSVLNALAEVENALVQEQRQKAYVESLKKQLDLSGQALGRVKDSFANGLVDYLRVLTAIQSYDRLERTAAGAQQTLILYRIALYRALGGPWKLKHYLKTETGK